MLILYWHLNCFQQQWLCTKCWYKSRLTLARSQYEPACASSLCQQCGVPDTRRQGPSAVTGLVWWQGWCGDSFGVVCSDSWCCSLSSYRQAQAAVLEALPRLRKLQVPTRRPDDYFAEMAKSDQQMQKVHAVNVFLSCFSLWQGLNLRCDVWVLTFISFSIPVTMIGFEALYRRFLFV